VQVRALRLPEQSARIRAGAGAVATTLATSSSIPSPAFVVGGRIRGSPVVPPAVIRWLARGSLWPGAPTSGPAPPCWPSSGAHGVPSTAGTRCVRWRPCARTSSPSSPDRPVRVAHALVAIGDLTHRYGIALCGFPVEDLTIVPEPSWKTSAQGAADCIVRMSTRGGQGVLS
jgi:hypothetical protein